MHHENLYLLFYVRKTKPLLNGEVAICLRITLDGRVKEITLESTIPAPLWIKRKHRASEESPKGFAANQEIDQLITRFWDAKRILEMEGKPVTITSLRNLVFGTRNVPKSLMEYYERHNQQMSQLVGTEFSPATLIRHQTSLNNLRSFLWEKKRIKDIFLEEVNNTFLRDFRHYLLTDRGCCNNTTIKYIKNLGKIIRQAHSEGIITKDPFVGIRYKLDKTDPPFLTENEIATLRSTTFSSPGLEYARDVFLFCCYTGLSYIDVYELRAKHFKTDASGNLWIRKKRGKTGVESIIPVLDVAEEILMKYYDHYKTKRSGGMLPVIANQPYNYKLKKIAALCGINKNLTSHIARHTFATTVTLQRGVSIEVVSKMLGHSSIAMTSHYARVLEGRIRDEVARLR